MLELLISTLISLGIQFTVLDSGKIQISPKDSAKMNSSEMFQNSETNSCDDIVITTGVDPSCEASTRE